MTSSLRRKRPTTRRRITAVRTATSLAVFGWLATAGNAQSPLRPLPGTVTGEAPARTMYYQKNSAPPAKPAVQPVKDQDQETAPFPLPPSVRAVIERAAKEAVDPKEPFLMKSEAQIDKAIVE